MQKGCKPKLIVKLYLELVFNMQLQICGDMQTFSLSFEQNCLPGMKIVSNHVGDHDAVLDGVIECLHVRVIDKSVIPVPVHVWQGIS